MPGTGKTACVNAIIKKLRNEYQNFYNNNIKKINNNNNKSRSKSNKEYINLLK
jgi:Cdc6-like AAA superfamily ATPase